MTAPRPFSKPYAWLLHPRSLRVGRRDPRGSTDLSTSVRSGPFLATLFLLASAAIWPIAAGAATGVPPIVTVARPPADVIADVQSPAVALNPKNVSNIVVASRYDAPDFQCQVNYSLDRGRTWTASDLPAPHHGTCWSPGVAFDDANHVYMAAQDRPKGGGLTDVSVWKSSDGGKTFTGPVTVPASVNGPMPGSSFQADIVVDLGQGPRSHHGRIYTTWYAGSPNFPAIRIQVSYSDDGGATWSAATSRPGPEGETQYLPAATVAPDGTLYVVYKDVQNFDAQGFGGCPAVGGSFTGKPVGTPSVCPVRVLRSSDGGATFDSLGPKGTGGFEAGVARYMGAPAYEQAAITTAPNGDVLVTYSSLPDEGAFGACSGQLQVFLTRSRDRGATWGPPVRVNDDACGNGASHFDPWTSVAPNGRVDVVYYDTRNDPGHVLMDAYYASSADGGATFKPSRRLTPTDFDSTVAFTPKNSGFQTADFDRRNGIVSTNMGVFAAWGSPVVSPTGDTKTLASDVVGVWIDAKTTSSKAGVSSGAIIAIGAVAIAAGVAAVMILTRRRRGRRSADPAEG